LTRHELKEQLQHDAFRDNVDFAVGYAAAHRKQVLRGAAILLAVLAIAGLSYAVYRYQKSQRQQALSAALTIAEAPVTTEPNQIGKAFANQQTKDLAAIKAMSDVAAKYNGTEEGDAAQYYLAGLQANQGKYSEAEKNLKAVSDSRSSFSALAKVALAQLYTGEGKTGQAKTILEGLVSHPTALVSREQATILLANAVKTSDPKRAKQLLESLKKPDERPAVERAANQSLENVK